MLQAKKKTASISGKMQRLEKAVDTGYRHKDIK